MMLLLLIIFIFFPSLSLIGPVLLLNNPKKWRYYIWMCAAFMGWLAFSYVPANFEQTDLSRYMLYLDIYKRYSLFEVFDIFYYKEIGEVLWIWTIGKLGFSGLLSGIPTAITYAIAIYISCDYAQRKGKLEEIRWVFLIQFLLLPFPSIVNNIFNVTAFSLLMLAVYRDLIQHKRNILTLCMYILPCFIHQSGIIIIGARFIAVAYKRFKYAYIIIFFGLPSLINLAYDYRNLFDNFRLIYKVIVDAKLYLKEFYVDYYAITTQTALLDRLSFLLNISFSSLSIISILWIWHRDKQKIISLNIYENIFLSFVLLIAVLALSCICFGAPLYWRFNFIVQLAIGVILVQFNRDNIVAQILKWSFLLLGIGQLVIQTYLLFGRYTNVNQYLINFVLGLPFKCFVEIL